MKQIYGISKYTCGVYLLRNKINGKKYIGSSKDISSRLALHFNRETRLYPYKPLYQDIIKYGRDNFEWEILETCEPSQLKEKEQLYYDLIQPEYNLTKPFTMEIHNKECEKRFEDSWKRTGEHLSELYSRQEYKDLFKEIQKNRFVPVKMLDKKTGEFIMNFESLQEASRWVTEHTNYKGKNKSSKILECCKGTRKSAFGYKWRYK